MADSNDVPPEIAQLISMAYAHFNARFIDAALSTMTPDVSWANGMEGGQVHGHDAVRAYWTRQFAIIQPHVEPVALTLLDDGRVAVEVHQVVRTLDGEVRSDRMVRHIYRLRVGLVAEMTIAEPHSNS